MKAHRSTILFVLGVALTALWLWLCYSYIADEVGFEVLGYLSPGEIFFGVTSIATPLLLIWLVLLYLERAGQLSADTEVLQQRLKALAYPEEEVEGRVAGITRSLLAQAEQLKAASAEAAARIDEARRAMGDDKKALDQTIAAASSEADRLRATLMQEGTALNEQGARALEAIERARLPFQHQMRALEEMTHQLREVSTNAVAAIGGKLEALLSAGRQAERFEQAANLMQGRARELTEALTATEAMTIRLSERLASQQQAAARVLEAGRVVEAQILPASEKLAQIAERANQEIGALTPRLQAETQRLEIAGQTGAATVTEAARRSQSSAEMIRDAARELTLSTGQANDATAALAENLGQQSQALTGIVREMGALGEGVLRLLQERTGALLDTGRGAEAAALALVEGLTPRIAELSQATQALETNLSRGKSDLQITAEATARVAGTALEALSQLRQSLDSGFANVSQQVISLKGEGELATQRFEELTSRLRRSSREEFLKAASGILEQLSAQSLDVHRLLADEPSEELFRRYRAGDKGVFARRLVKLKDTRAAEIIKKRYERDAEFKRLVDRFSKDYEGLLEEAALADPAHTLSATFMTADVGRLYLLLTRAIGKGH